MVERGDEADLGVAEGHAEIDGGGEGKLARDNIRVSLSVGWRQ